MATSASPLKFVYDKCNTSLAVPILPHGAKLEGPFPRCGNHLVFSGAVPEPVMVPAAAPSPAVTAPAARNPALELYGPPKNLPAAKPARAKVELAGVKSMKTVELVSLTAIVMLTLAIAWAAWTKFRPVPPAKVISFTQPG